MPQLLSAMSTKGKLTLAAVAAGFLIVAFMLIRMASAPSYMEVLSGADPAKTGKVTSALDAAGVAYEIRSAGTAVAVDKAMLSQARIALSSAGLGAGSSGQQPGFELLDKQKLGSSSFQQQVAYQRALEGEIASTVDQVEGVDGASVSLTLPKDQLFADEAKGATAAVMLGGGATMLDAGQVRGIANLVAASVQDLKPDAVTITDGTGNMLWPADGAAGGGMGKPAAQARFDQRLSSSLNTMLTTTLGPGRATVSVSSDLNVDEATKEQLTYAKTGTPLEVKTETETLRGTGGGAQGGAAGTGTNLPAYAQAGAAGATTSSNYRKASETSKLGVDKVVTRTKVASGAVNRLNVAVMIDKGAKADIPAITAAISSAAGIDAERGDTLAVREVAFAKPATDPAAAPAAGLPVPAGVLSIAKPVGAGLAGLLFLFFVTKHLRRREADVFAQEPSWLRQLESGGGSRGLGPGGLSAMEEEELRIQAFDAQAAARKVFEHDPRALALEDLVVREPEKVAHQLRTWITEDKS